jgi:nucleoside-diphosphate-sugar epimerase
VTESPRQSRLITGRRVFVTGAAGFIGKHLLREAARQGADVTAIVRPGTDRERLIGIPTSVVEVDLRNEKDVANMFEAVGRDHGFDVIHAASSAGHSSPDAHVEAWNANTMTTIHLLAALRRHDDIRIIHVGAGTEYGPSDTPHREEFAARPLSVRGASKLAATTAVLQWAYEFDHPVAVVRPFSVYGPGEPEKRLISTLLRCAKNGEPFGLVEGTSRRDLVSVHDVAEGVLRSFAATSRTGPIINLGTGVEHCVGGVIDLVERITKRKVQLSPIRRPRHHHDPAHWCADTTTCERTLGWKPTRSLTDGITEMWNVYGLAA